MKIKEKINDTIESTTDQAIAAFCMAKYNTLFVKYEIEALTGLVRYFLTFNAGMNLDEAMRVYATGGQADARKLFEKFRFVKGISSRIRQARREGGL